MSIPGGGRVAAVGLLPRMNALLLRRAPLPQRMAIAPYIEMAYQPDLARVAPLLAALQRLDRHLGGDPQ